MNNLKYYPFERNRYYYGKLLTEQDFIQDQQYYNDKRRLHNRFLHGVGIAAGLRVVMVDEKSISVEDGVAFDFSGREIVVDVPSVYRLSTIDGFEAIMEQGRGDYAYLCIAYEEHGEVPAYNVASGEQKQENAFDKTRENYHLYLTDQEPDNNDLTMDGLFEKKEVLYEDYQIRITQTVPISVKAGEQMETTISLENISNAVQVSVELEETLESAFCGKETFLQVKWDKVILERGEKLSKTFVLQAMELEHGSIVIHVQPENILIQEGRDILHPSEKKSIQISLTKADNIQSMIDRYFETVMEKTSRNNYPQGIYLAKISLMKLDNTYMIEHVSTVPFHQYLYSTFLLMGITHGMQRDLKMLKDLKQCALPMENVQNKSLPQMTYPERKASGVVQISLGIGGKRDQIFFSQEIVHGLGLGPVHLDLSIQQDQMLYYGVGDMFYDMEVKAELAAKVDTAKGTFTIGVRMIEPTSKQFINVHWRAVADALPELEDNQERYLYIVPNKLELWVQESYSLKAVCENMPYATIIWKTNGLESGSIASNGTYTAPGIPGIYEVTAYCQEVPELKSSIFIVVRE